MSLDQDMSRWKLRHAHQIVAYANLTAQWQKLRHSSLQLVMVQPAKFRHNYFHPLKLVVHWLKTSESTSAPAPEFSLKVEPGFLCLELELRVNAFTTPCSRTRSCFIRYTHSTWNRRLDVILEESIDTSLTRSFPAPLCWALWQHQPFHLKGGIECHFSMSHM